MRGPSSSHAVRRLLLIIACCGLACGGEPSPAPAASSAHAVSSPRTEPPAPALVPAEPPLSEEQQMLAALRARLVELHGPMDLTSVSVARKGEWAWLVAQPHRPGAPGDAFERVSALVRAVDGRWALAEIACAEVDNIECLGSPEFATRFAARHPGVPLELLPADAVSNQRPGPREGRQKDAKDRPAGVADSFDDRCDTAADCAVKNVGSCCGYNPRCLRKDAPDPPPYTCPKGAAGVCGFRSIESCACVEHRCQEVVPSPRRRPSAPSQP